METLKSLILDQEHITAVKRVCCELIHSVTVIYFMLNKRGVTLFNLCLLLTEFEGRTVSYEPSIFLLDLWPKREAPRP